MTQQGVDFAAVHLHVQLIDSPHVLAVDFGQVSNLKHVSCLDGLCVPNLVYPFKILLAAFIGFGLLLAALLDTVAQICLAQLNTKAEEPMLAETSGDSGQNPREINADCRRENAKGCHQD